MLKYMDEKTRKLLLIFVGLVVLMLLVFLIVFIIGKVSNSKLSYDEIENKMASAAEEYFKDNKNLLPSENEEVSVDVSTLASSEYMKELIKYQKDESTSCSGKVIVTKTGEYYNYSPYLNCGSEYTTKYLYEKLIESVVVEKDGLYETEQYYDGENDKVYIYRGEFPKNYVSIDDNLWRIIKVNSDSSIMIIQANYDKKINDEVVWDNRYNIETSSYEGINDFEKSRIKVKLDSYYTKEKLYPEELKMNVVPKKVCIGGRSIKDTINDGSIECGQMSDYLVYFSLLQTNDFINASLDSNCKKIEDQSCANYNYLNKFGRTWWFLTVNSKSYNKSYVGSQNAYRRVLSQKAIARVVTNLNKNVIYAGGDGSKTNPFIIK